MIYKFVILIVTLNVLYEMIEFIFPIGKMKQIIKSFTLIVFLYEICQFVISL